jgi:PKD repeat protein
MSATEVTFTSQGASDPDNDPLTYAWDFGDGGQATGQGVMHVYRSAGTFTAKVTVSDGKKSVSATAAPVVVRSMQGGWRRVFNFSNIAVFDLNQTDTTIGGAYVSHTWANSDFSTQGPTIVRGSRVSAPRRVVIQTLIPTYLRGAFFGTYTVSYACDLNDALTSCEGSASGRNGNPFFHVFAMSRQ